MTMTTTIPQAAPRGLDVIIEDVQQRTACPHCSAGRTQPCALPRPGGCTWPGSPGPAAKA